MPSEKQRSEQGSEQPSTHAADQMAEPGAKQGEASAGTQESQRSKPIRDWTEEELTEAVQRTVASELTRADLAGIMERAIGDRIDRLFPGPGRAGVHVNSGPTGHANVPGHADFTRAGMMPGAGRAGAHVNSGPTGHANVPGHADFTRSGRLPDIGRAGAHVNSGPTGHANVPGHADFTRAGMMPGAGRAGAHVNSGPTGHANVPGHADFTRSGIERPNIITVHMPDGTAVSLPESGGPSVINLGGLRITR